MTAAALHFRAASGPTSNPTREQTESAHTATGCIMGGRQGDFRLLRPSPVITRNYSPLSIVGKAREQWEREGVCANGKW